MRTFAHAISFVFHPLFVMTYMLILLAFINPYLFGVHQYNDPMIIKNLILIFAYTFLIPTIASIMMKFLGFVESLEMEDKKERIGPLLVCMVCYFMVSYIFYRDPEVPNALTIFAVGSSIALSFAFFINLFSKISLHAIGMGGFLGMIVITMIYFSYGSFSMGSVSVSMNFLLMVVILISGLVGTSRLILEAHEPMDLYGGFFIGFGAQFLALTLLS